MKRPRPKWDMETLIGTLLWVGVCLSAAFLFAGILWRWILTGNPRLEYTLSGTNLFQFWIADIRQVTAGAFRPRLLVNLGIGLLMLTPYLRVFASFVYFFAVEKSFKYTLFTFFVFSVLSCSLFLR